MRMKTLIVGSACAVAMTAMLAAVAAGQDMPQKKSPSVTFTAPPIANIVRGQEGALDLRFRVASGFHINSNAPTEDYLIPTALKLDVPTDLIVGRIAYPAGEETSFAFAPDEKLSVYSGDFEVTVKVRALSTVIPGKYEFRGQLKYQACDNAACYPPKQTPVSFEIKVVKAPAAKKANPAQSPHAHS